MKKLLKEFLSYVLETDSSSSQKSNPWQTAGGTWTAKRSDGTRRGGFSSREKAQAWMSGTGRAPAKEKPTGKRQQRQQTQTTNKRGQRSKPDTTQGQVDMSGTEGMSAATRETISALPGGTGAYAAVTGQKIAGGTGQGIGTSKAAEASKVILCSVLLRSRPRNMSMEEYLDTPEAKSLIVQTMADLQNAPGSKLTEAWAQTAEIQARTSLIETERTFGSPITGVAWDNVEGRASLGLGKKHPEDRSDSYYELEDGRIIGTSLKQNGKVFLANPGFGKSMTQMAGYTNDSGTKAKFNELRSVHRNESNRVITSIIRRVQDPQTGPTLQSKMTGFNRNDHPELKMDGTDYDKYFDNSGKLKIDETTGKPLLLAELDPNNPKPTTSATKTLLKILSVVDREGTTTELRAVDNTTTQLLMTQAEDTEFRSAMIRYVSYQLDIPQMVSQRPFGEPTEPGQRSVSAITTVYGEGSVDNSGNRSPLFVHGATVRQLFNIPEDVPDESIGENVSQNLIIDSDSDSGSGILRIRVRNPAYKGEDGQPTDGEPEYFYPPIATVQVRARGLGEAAVMECLQHDGYTHMLSAGSADPRKWTPEQQLAEADSAVRYLYRQSTVLDKEIQTMESAPSDGLSDEEKKQRERVVAEMSARRDQMRRDIAAYAPIRDSAKQEIDKQTSSG